MEDGAPDEQPRYIRILRPLIIFLHLITSWPNIPATKNEFDPLPKHSVSGDRACLPDMGSVGISGQSALNAGMRLQIVTDLIDSYQPWLKASLTGQYNVGYAASSKISITLAEIIECAPIRKLKNLLGGFDKPIPGQVLKRSGLRCSPLFLAKWNRWWPACTCAEE